MTLSNMKKNHTKRLRAWDAAVKRRRIQIIKAIALVQKLRRRGAPQTKAKAKLANLEFYGVLNNGKKHWTKIKGVWGK
jgi:hypothetical protein